MIGKMKPEPGMLADLIVDSMNMLSHIVLREWYRPGLSDYRNFCLNHDPFRLT